MLGDKQVMSVSGHKSTNSLNIYQHVDNEDKLKMGASLSKMLNTNDDRETIWQQVDEEFQNYAQKCNSVETEPEDPIPQKHQALAIPDYNQPTEPD